MQELLTQFFEYARGMWRFRYPALLTAWIVALVGWIVVMLLPPVYQATSRVYVDTTAVLGPLLEGIAVEQNVQAQLNYVRQMMLSRPQLEAVARETDLDLGADSEREKERMLQRLAKNITIEAVLPGGERSRDQSSLFSLAVKDSDRGRALKTMQTLVDSFVESSLGGKRTNADSAQRFLREQIAEYEQRLGDSESKLADFKRKNIGLVPGDQGDYFTRLQNETGAAQKIEAQLRVTAQRRAELSRQMSGEQPFVPGALGVGVGAEGGTRVEEAQKRLDELLLRYTEKHPEVIAARETLDQLKAREQADLAALQAGRGGSARGMTSNPVYQQIQLQMNQADVEMTSLRSELAVHQQNVAQLRSMVNTAPEVEAEYAKLSRDYDVTKARYNELVNRLDQARISEQAEQTGIVRLEVIDPPTVGVEPVAPVRPRLMTVVLIAALLVGAAVAFLGHHLRPVFSSTRGVTQVTGLPVLGAVARTWMDRHRTERRQQMWKVVGALGALFVVFVIVLFIQDSGAHALQSLMRRV